MACPSCERHRNSSADPPPRAVCRLFFVRLLFAQTANELPSGAQEQDEDCHGAPGTIGAAVRSGHRYARELDETKDGDGLFLRERPEIFI